MSEVKGRHVIAKFLADVSPAEWLPIRAKLVVWSDGEISLVVPGHEPVEIARWGQRPYLDRHDCVQDCAMPTKGNW